MNLEGTKDTKKFARPPFVPSRFVYEATQTMIVLGLTGGIASGKSFVAGLLAERGAVVLDADRHAHAALADPAVVAQLVQRWGEAVLADDGRVRRSEIAARVFGEGEAATAERRFLESIVHPWVRQRLNDELAQASSSGAPAAVLDIPLLIEAGWAERCDAVLFVQTPEPIRRERAAERGWDAAELTRREAAQTALSEKRAAADATVPGDDPQAARAAVEAVWDRWVLGDSDRPDG